MKKIGPDLGRNRIGADSKDKQTLVLFLLGCGILALSFLARAQEPPFPRYVVARQAGTDRWQVVSLAGEFDGKESFPEKFNLFSQQRGTSRHFFENYEGSNLPPELALFFNRPLPLNRSQQSDLEMLPGVGPRLATVMLTERQKKGRFTGPGDLLDVPGIGPANLQRILPLVSFE